ncbi:hypothetical protein C0Q70_18779 [Pomacea canaliculata]|uniref:SCP domain-containing protein n=1 Tax=Pomacea canaliculata TaxID=400727 RepID=A0A2T7NHG9_POMCA|nr:hypothetical protein C0Q70_18779 [Pomacea canaliculata]
MQKVVEGDRPRQRRQTSDNGVRGFSETQKQALLDIHNYDRRLRKASDMRLMEWNSKLEQLAQDWADGCNFEHRRDTPGVPTGFSYNGENLYAATHTYDPVFILRGWHDEEEIAYDYETGDCKSVCGHYTQVVWASSYAVGCGVTYCSTLRNVNFNQGYYVVCNYGPGGNYAGQKPYKLGSGPCTECPDDAPYCVDGLCGE